jgi:UDP-N-acetylglucosamine 2-epimerase
MNRQITSRIADVHFAPTEPEKNLLKEKIFVKTSSRLQVIQASDAL